MKTRYLVLFVLGAALPFSQLLPWLFTHGLDPRQFYRDLFANRIGAFFALDVIISAIVVLSLVRDEWKRRRLRFAWLPVVATLLVGVSAGLPLLVYLRGEER